MEPDSRTSRLLSVRDAVAQFQNPLIFLLCYNEYGSYQETSFVGGLVSKVEGQHEHLCRASPWCLVFYSLPLSDTKFAADATYYEQPQSLLTSVLNKKCDLVCLNRTGFCKRGLWPHSRKNVPRCSLITLVHTFIFIRIDSTE